MARLIAESVEGCTASAETMEQVAFHRGRLDAFYRLQHLPELEAKRRTIRTGATVAPEEQPALPRWRERLAHAWRTLRAA